MQTEIPPAVEVVERDAVKSMIIHNLNTSMYVFEGRVSWDGYVWFVSASSMREAKKKLFEVLGLSKENFKDIFHKPDGIRHIGKGFVSLNLEIQSEFIETYPNGTIRIGWSE